MPIYKETGPSLSYMPLSSLLITLRHHLREGWSSCFFLLLLLAFTSAKGIKGSSSRNPFPVAQYCPAGAPQESPPRSTEDLRKGLHQPILSGMPSTWERMQRIPWPQVSGSWSKRACGYLLSWVHYCDRAMTINSLRHHQRHPQHEEGEGDTSGVFNHHFFQEKQPSGAFLWWQMWEYQRRSRRLLYLGQQTKHLLAGRLENNIKSTEDKFPLTAKCCPEMSHAGTFQSNLLHSHQGICRQKGFIYIFSCFLSSENIQILMGK